MGWTGVYLEEEVWLFEMFAIAFVFNLKCFQDLSNEIRVAFPRKPYKTPFYVYSLLGVNLFPFSCYFML